jgi:hypothetical protein
VLGGTKVIASEIDANVLSELGLSLDKLESRADLSTVTPDTTAGYVSCKNGQ